MPENGSLNQESTFNSGITAEVVEETLIFSSDLIKTETFTSEDHVILVVPESAEHLVTAESINSDGFLLPVTESSQNSDDTTSLDLSPERLRQTINSNFLVITKLLPSQSPPPLTPFAIKTTSTSTHTKDFSRVSEKPAETLEASTVAPFSFTANRRIVKSHKQVGRNHSVQKQEVPEIFGKMFPVTYNNVLWKQIRDIIHFKGGKEMTDDTEISTGVLCPHCRKKPSTLNLLKQHLNDCHTYSAKRKLTSPVSKTGVTKKMLYRCQHCGEAFISLERRESHECTLSPKPLTPTVGGATTHPNTCNICFQDFGSQVEMSIHQEVDHCLPKPQLPVKTVPPIKKIITMPSISKYVSCKVCQKKISVRVLQEHLLRHQQAGVSDSHNNDSSPVGTKKCKSCFKVDEELGPDDEVCNSCLIADPESQDSSICPICDIEIPLRAHEKHVMMHYSPSEKRPKPPLRTSVCASCKGDFKLSLEGDEAKCKKCR